MRKNLHVADLGDLLEEPLNGVLATYRSNGEILLSPIWYEWFDGGFNVIVLAHDAKHRNVQSDPRASIVVAENGGRNRGIEVRGMAHVTSDDIEEVYKRILQRYVLPKYAALFLRELARAPHVHIRLEPGTLRVWDFANLVDFVR